MGTVSESGLNEASTVGSHQGGGVPVSAPGTVDFFTPPSSSVQISGKSSAGTGPWVTLVATSSRERMAPWRRS